MLRLLCVTAHPDDESGAFGGTLKLYHDRSVETSVLCLTPGQAARHRGTAKTDEELAAVRRREFAAACHILHVTHPVILDYPDSRLDRADFLPIVAEITLHIRRFRPQVLITIGPEGMITAHPDHSMASLFATAAYQWAGRSSRFPDQLKNGLQPHRIPKLYYGTANFTLPDRDPVSLAPITAEIDIGTCLETKIAAFHAHLTQAPLFPIFESTVARRPAKEFFHLAACSHPGPIEHETDLFAGIRESD